LLLLTGAGSSFCIKNAAGSKVTSKTAPGLQDLWNAVKAKVGDKPFDDVIALIPTGSPIEDIEKLLTQCKLYVALYGGTDGNGKIIADFVKNAEDAIPCAR
jgi:riboflavin synthase